MTALCKTLCVNCRHHVGSGVWYAHYCQHPDKRRPKEQDPVTGEIFFAIRNDLGNVCFTCEQYPHCRDINHGNCPLYEEG